MSVEELRQFIEDEYKPVSIKDQYAALDAAQGAVGR